MTADRRSFLRGALFGAGAATAATTSTAALSGEPTGANPAHQRYPFTGPHQAGVLRPNANSAAVVAFDVVAANRNELRELLRAITDRARNLTAGGPDAPVGISAPPNDSGILGPNIPPDGLTVTLGLGASLFDNDRYRLGARKPAKLKPMRTFPNDTLDPAQCHGDLCLTLAANHQDAVLHALRDLARHTRGAMQVRWRCDGFSSPSRPTGTPRNLLGFKDGIANPNTKNPTEMNKLIWTRSGGGEPDWVDGGTYQVVRLIRMLVEFWDRVTVSEQENIIGRRRDSGAPLDGQHETDIPHYAVDPAGTAVPITAHIRLANPRTPNSEQNRILRRSYNYDRGTDGAGNLDMGLIFTCYQQDVDRQFETVQTRLIDEPLVDYIQPFGGGYFFVVPGVTDRHGFLGEGMLDGMA